MSVGIYFVRDVYVCMTICGNLCCVYTRHNSARHSTAPVLCHAVGICLRCNSKGSAKLCLQIKIMSVVVHVGMIVQKNENF